jgi:hypothetical protein
MIQWVATMEDGSAKAPQEPLAPEGLKSMGSQPLGKDHK